MKKMLLLVCLLASVVFVNAHNIQTEKDFKEVITGKVVDSESGEALAGVCIKIENTNYEVYTDFDGNFEIKMGEECNKFENIVISYISYQEKKIKLNKFANSTIEIIQVL